MLPYRSLLAGSHKIEKDKRMANNKFFILLMVYHVVRQSPHALRVCKLYRRILKEQQSWVGDRLLWNEIALNTRNAFKAQKTVSSKKAEFLVKDAEEQLEYWRHPNPIISKHYSQNITHNVLTKHRSTRSWWRLLSTKCSSSIRRNIFLMFLLSCRITNVFIR